jgi:hypothetical protein
LVGRVALVAPLVRRQPLVRRRTPILAALLVALSAIAITGCGSSARAASAHASARLTTKAEYIVEADGLCTAEGAALAPILKQYDAINSINSTDSAHAAALVTSADMVKTSFLSRLRALTPPPADRAALAKVWDTYSTFIQQTQQFAAAVRDDNFDLADKLAAPPADASYERLAHAYGFTVCGAVTTPGRSKSTAAPTKPKPAPVVKPQTFSGVGSENIGTITVPVASTLKWSCPTCASGAGNFIIDNSATNASQIDVNALRQTSGKTVVNAGTYTDVSIETEGGSWTITVSPGNSTQSSAATPTPASVASLLWKGWYGIALGVKDHNTASALSSANVVCSLFSPPVARSWIELVKNENGHLDTCPVALVVSTAITHQSPSEFSTWQHVKTLHQTATTAVCELENPSWGNPTVHLGLYSGTWLMVQWKGNG